MERVMELESEWEEGGKGNVKQENERKRHGERGRK